MPLPVMTPEQRAANLLKAQEARRARSALLAAVKNGTLTPAALLERVDTEPLVGKTKLAAVLRAVPGIGPVAVERILRDVDATDDQVLKSLKGAQRQRLVEVVAAVRGTA